MKGLLNIDINLKAVNISQVLQFFSSCFKLRLFIFFDCHIKYFVFHLNTIKSIFKRYIPTVVYFLYTVMDYNPLQYKNARYIQT